MLASEGKDSGPGHAEITAVQRGELDLRLGPDPQEQLLQGIRQSDALQKTLETIPAEKILRVVSRLVPFAPITPKSWDIERKADSAVTRGFYLADGTAVRTGFDEMAFTFVCNPQSLGVPLSPEELHQLWEGLKNSGLLQRVYTDPNLMMDSGQAAISLEVQQALARYAEYREHQANYLHYENYFEGLDQARELLAANVEMVKKEDRPARVGLFFKERASEIIRPYVLQEDLNSPSGENLVHVDFYHALTTGGGYFPDTFASLQDILRNGFNQTFDTRRPGPNAAIGFGSFDITFAEQSLTTRDRYVLKLGGAASVVTGPMMVAYAAGGEVSALPEPMVANSGSMQARIDKVPANEISVWVLVPRGERAAKVQFYKEQFEAEFPEVEIEISEADLDKPTIEGKTNSLSKLP